MSSLGTDQLTNLIIYLGPAFSFHGKHKISNVISRLRLVLSKFSL